MKKGLISRIKTALGIVLIGTLISPLANANKPFPHAVAKAKETYLMVQSAQTADITHDKKTNSYNVILKNVAPFVAYFSERPDRKAGSMTIEAFLKLWQHKGENSFGANPPNADIHATQLMSSTESINFPVEISAPIYNAENRTLSYTAKPLKGANVFPEAATVQHVLLFIDDVCLTCW